MTVLDERTTTRVRSLALEITGQCQNTCASHCYAQSGPHRGHGSMTRDDWFAVLGQAAEYGMTMIQYIGGEPTLHPYLPQLIGRARLLGLRVEVFSNLVHVRPSLWEAFARSGVTLATSYYSSSAAEHEEITGGRGSYARTRASIAEAVRRSIPLRAGIIHVHDGQRIDAARAELRSLGVTGPIGADRVRHLGNAADAAVSDPAQLRGRCGTDRAAISPDGVVTPCVMARWMATGDVRRQPLAEILTGPAWADRMAAIPRGDRRGCTPDEDSCAPSPGRMSGCSPDDQSCQPGQPACLPKYPHHPESR